MTGRRLALGLILFAAGAVAGAQAAVLAEVGGRTITREQFGWWLHVLRADGNDERTLQTLTPEGQQRILENMVTQRLFAEAARAKGLDREPRLAFLAEQHTASLLAERYEASLTSGITEIELRDYFDTHGDRFRPGKRVRASHILAATREDAEAALRELRSGADFAETARRRSTDTRTAGKGGDLGWVVGGVMVPDVEKVLFGSKAGAVSDVVQTNYGFHLLKVNEVDPGEQAPYEAVRDVVRRQLTADRIAAERQRLAALHGVKVNPELLRGEAR